MSPVKDCMLPVLASYTFSLDRTLYGWSVFRNIFRWWRKKYRIKVCQTNSIHYFKSYLLIRNGLQSVQRPSIHETNSDNRIIIKFIFSIWSLTFTTHSMRHFKFKVQWLHVATVLENSNWLNFKHKVYFLIERLKSLRIVY